MGVLFKGIEPSDIEWALALEEVVFEKVRANGVPILRCWRTLPRSLTIGRFQCAKGEVDLGLSRDLGIPVVRRMSGGGAVLNDGEGEFAFSLSAPVNMISGGISGAYRAVLEPIVRSFMELGLDTFIDGTSIFMKGGGKVVGSSMRWTWDTVQVHGTVLHSMDSELMKRLLWGGRFGCVDATPSARKEVSPISKHVDISLSELAGNVLGSILPDRERMDLEWSEKDLERSRSLARSKYCDPGWNLRL